jgi:hypothetical protein
MNREPAEDNLHPAAASNSSVAGGAEGEAMSIVTDLLDDRGISKPANQSNLSPPS